MKNKEELKKIITQYRFPNGVLGEHIAYKTIFEQMKKDGVLPQKWKYPSTVAKFMEREKLFTSDYHEDWVLSIMLPILNKIEINMKARFVLFWDRLGHDGRTNFLKTICKLMEYKTPKENVYGEIINSFTNNKFLSKKIIDYYIPIEFEDVNINEDYSTKLMRSIIEDIGFIRKEQLIIHWHTSESGSKTLLLKNIGKKLMGKGIPAPEISTTICKGCEELGILNSTTIREYIPQEFKNMKMSDRKKGKTFEKAGRKKKGVM